MYMLQNNAYYWYVKGNDEKARKIQLVEGIKTFVQGLLRT